MTFSTAFTVSFAVSFNVSRDSSAFSPPFPAGTCPASRFKFGNTTRKEPLVEKNSGLSPRGLGVSFP